MDDIRIAGDREIEAPVTIHASLPNIGGFVVLLGMERGVVKVKDEKSGLFVERLSNIRRRL